MRDVIPWFVRAGFDYQEFSAGGIRTFAVIEGKPQSFPVIFLHGIPAISEIWLPAITALSRQRLAIAPDLPGYGNSQSRFHDAPLLTPMKARAWMNGLLHAQGIARFDLVADGFGAWIALEMLAQNPERIRRLSLISLRLWKSQAQIPFGQKVRTWFARKPNLEKLYAPEFAKYRNALAGYKGATLLVWGKADMETPENHITELLSALPSAEARRLEAGHFPMLEQADMLAELLKSFLED